MEKWDKREKEMDEMVADFKDIPPRARKLMIQALEIYLTHSDNCHYVKLLVSETKIKKLECVDCGWQYLKPWWKFW